MSGTLWTRSRGLGSVRESLALLYRPSVVSSVNMRSSCRMKRYGSECILRLPQLAAPRHATPRHTSDHEQVKPTAVPSHRDAHGLPPHVCVFDPQSPENHYLHSLSTLNNPSSLLSPALLSRLAHSQVPPPVRAHQPFSPSQASVPFSSNCSPLLTLFLSFGSQTITKQHATTQ